MKVASESTAVSSGKGDNLKRLEQQLSQKQKMLDVTHDHLEAAETKLLDMTHAAETSVGGEAEIRSLKNQLQVKDEQCEFFKGQLEASDNSDGKDEVKVLRHQLLEIKEQLSLSRMKVAAESTKITEETEYRGW